MVWSTPERCVRSPVPRRRPSVARSAARISWCSTWGSAVRWSWSGCWRCATAWTPRPRGWLWRSPRWTCVGSRCCTGSGAARSRPPPFLLGPPRGDRPDPGEACRCFARVPSGSGCSQVDGSDEGAGGGGGPVAPAVRVVVDGVRAAAGREVAVADMVADEVARQYVVDQFLLAAVDAGVAVVRGLDARREVPQAVAVALVGRVVPGRAVID